MAEAAAPLLSPIVAISHEDLAPVVAFAEGVPEAPHWPAEAWDSFVSPEENTAVFRRIFVIRLPTGDLAGMIAVARCDRTTELELLLVAPHERRRGLGARLSEHWMEWAEASGATEAYLEVRASNFGAQSLYRSLGFLECGRRPNYYQHPVEEAVLMQRLLL